MDKAIQLTNELFGNKQTKGLSWCNTLQYLTWFRTFKREFTKFLTEFATGIDIHKPNLFDMSGFFKIKDQIWYFSVSDLRMDKKMLIRTAEHYKDYSGGYNQFVTLTDGFKEELKRIVI